MAQMTTVTLEKPKTEEVKLTPEELKDLRAEVLDKIIVARVGLLLRHPFLVIWPQGLLLKSVMIGVVQPQLMVDIYFIIQDFSLK